MTKEKLWNSNYIKVWLGNFMIFFSFMILTPLLPLYLSDTYHVDKSVIGIVLSGYTLTALLARCFSGYLVDSYPRRIVLLTSYFLFFAFFAGYLIAGSMTLFAIIRTLHGAPMGAVTVANSTVAIDVLHPTRRAEGIGYYGLSNNFATSIAPTIGLLIYDYSANYDLIFAIALIAAGLGVAINATVKFRQRDVVLNKEPISLDRFFLKESWSEGICIAAFSFSYGVLSTYLAIYGKETLGITSGTGLFFFILSAGLVISRLVGAKNLSQGKCVENVSHGILISVFGYLLFAAVHSPWAYYGTALIIGLGNGHMFPGMQTMFINLAPNNKRGTANSSQLTCWDIGMGLGVLLGGSIAEAMGYNAAFWAAWLVNLAGVLFFFGHVRASYNKHKLR